ncbi:MAG: coenzyme F(420) biosynthesis enzyme [Schwartzia sp.]|nr:coenzyme F(420) biosynthesis enzyme [Schwartzia sp. (in: firmicutes)]
MKKIVQLVIAMIMMMAAGVASAHVDTVTIPEGADITGIERIAVAKPLYTPLKDYPSMDELTLAVSDGIVKLKTDLLVVSYDEMARNIMNDTKKDIRSLDRHVAAKVFRDNVPKYADAYVVLTVANNTRTVFFFDVYRAGTNDLIYSNQMITTSDEGDNVKDYTGMAADFYKSFSSSKKLEIEKREKAQREAQKAAEKAKRDKK